MTRSQHSINQARNFAEGRETSDEIAQAILELAEFKYGTADRIWAEPTPEEDAAVVARAWQLAGPEEAELHWGQSTIRR